MTTYATMLLFTAGMIISLLGSLPPGLISLSVAQAALARSLNAALLLAIGAAAAEFFQAWAAVALTDWFLANPAMERYFQWVALPVFFGAAVYLWFWAAPPRPPGELPPLSPWQLLGRGVLISLFNLLAIPYWFVYCAWLHVNGWWPVDSLGATLTFSAGVAAGTLAALALYAWLARYLLANSEAAARHANRLIALVFLFLGMKLAWEMF